MTPLGWLLTVLVIVGAGVVAVRNAYPFLALNAPVGAGFLVVEGWMTDEYHKKVVELSQDGRYRQVLTSGGPLRQGRYLIGYGTYADLTAASLKALGLKEDRVQAVPAPEVKRDRTYHAALAVRKWLDGHGWETASVDVVTLGAHARRTWLLYREALGRRHPVGIISLPPEDFEPAHWWRYSAGVRQVIGETIAYLYARFLFSPAEAG